MAETTATPEEELTVDKLGDKKEAFEQFLKNQSSSLEKWESLSSDEKKKLHSEFLSSELTVSQNVGEKEKEEKDPRFAKLAEHWEAWAKGKQKDFSKTEDAKELKMDIGPKDDEKGAVISYSSANDASLRTPYTSKDGKEIVIFPEQAFFDQTVRAGVEVTGIKTVNFGDIKDAEFAYRLLKAVDNINIEKGFTKENGLALGVKGEGLKLLDDNFVNSLPKEKQKDAQDLLKKYGLKAENTEEDTKGQETDGLKKAFIEAVRNLGHAKIDGKTDDELAALQKAADDAKNACLSNPEIANELEKRQKATGKHFADKLTKEGKSKTEIDAAFKKRKALREKNINKLEAKGIKVEKDLKKKMKLDFRQLSALAEKSGR